MIGKRFFMLKVLSLANNKRYYNCVCDCGKIHKARKDHLLSGAIKSCGCYKSIHKISHGKSGTSIYNIWFGMLSRCNRKQDPNYKRYGARGIKVCKRWYKFEIFYKDMGDRPQGKSLERINNNGNYKPSNCRWANWTEQCSNRRDNQFVFIKNEKLTISAACRKYGINHARVYRLRKKNKTFQEIVDSELITKTKGDK